jgi:hypothetical protein
MDETPFGEVMNAQKWAYARRKIHQLRPTIQLALVALGITTESIAIIAVALGLGIVDIAFGFIAADYVDLNPDASNRSEVSVSTPVESLPTSPCKFVHGAADEHVPGCEGWASGSR